MKTLIVLIFGATLLTAGSAFAGNAGDCALKSDISRNAKETQIRVAKLAGKKLKAKKGTNGTTRHKGQN